MLPGVRLEQIGQKRCLTTRSTPWDMLRGFNQRSSKSRACASTGAPTSAPPGNACTKAPLPLVGQQSDHLRSFIAPAPACFESHPICSGLTLPPLGMSPPSLPALSAAPVSAACGCASPSQLNTQTSRPRRTAPPRNKQVLGKDFDLPCVLGAHLDIHVLEEHIWMTHYSYEFGC